MRFDNSGSYVFIHVQQKGPWVFYNILDKSNIKICDLNLTFKQTEDQVLRSNSPPNRNRSAEIQRLLYPQKQMISCINRKRSPFKIKPFSDIYVKFQGNWRELKFSKCHGHFQNKDSFTLAVVVRLVIKTEGTTWEEVPRFDWTSHQRSRSLNCSAISPCWKVGGMLGQLVVSFSIDPNAMGMAWSCEQTDGAYYYKIEVDPLCRTSFQHRASCFCWFRSFNNPTGQSWANLHHFWTSETLCIPSVFPMTRCLIQFPIEIWSTQHCSIWWFLALVFFQPFGRGAFFFFLLKSWYFLGDFCCFLRFYDSMNFVFRKKKKKCIKNWGFSKIPKKNQRSASCEERHPLCRMAGLKATTLSPKVCWRLCQKSRW